jgi:N-alpha-acetyltransferase 35, NatC auxiliary subunit
VAVDYTVANISKLKEEDFVTNTYSRSLLEAFEIPLIRKVLDTARATLSSLDDGSISSDLIQALDARLMFRDAFLVTMESTLGTSSPDYMRTCWKEGILILERIKKSHALGKELPDAFSPKLQRKLASTMPPRPIVQISFDLAFGHLTSLFKDGIEVIDVFNYTDSQCLQVPATI